MTETSRHEMLLSFLIGHDANACLISLEGQWGYENSERVDGIKQSSDYQVAVDRLLMRLGVKKVDINLLVLTTTQGALLPIFNEKKFDIIEWKKHKFITPSRNLSQGRAKSKDFKNMAYSLKTENAMAPCMRVESLSDFRSLLSGKIELRITDFIIEGTAEFYGRKVRCFHVEHHLAHICSSFMRQKNANVCISMDGASRSIYNLRLFPFWGGFSAARVGEELVLSPPSLFAGGILYSKAASYLGLTEGKLMGLAGYFVMNENAENLFLEKWENLMIELEDIYDVSLMISDLEIADTDTVSKDKQCDKNLYSILESIGQMYKELHSPVARIESMPKGAHILVAASVQKVFERMRRKAVRKTIEYFLQQGVEIEGIVFTGGCTLNCPSNNLLVEDYPNIPLMFDNACNDEGLSLGAAHAINLSVLGEKFNVFSNINTPFIGSHVEFLEEGVELANSLGFRIINLADSDDVVYKIAHAIAGMGIIILCHGRYESGPRALGNRSFIGNASDRKTHDTLNLIKQRENWRPIAPMVREVDFKEYFVGPKDPHMLMNDVVINRASIPAVTHSDNSARVQVVSDTGSMAYRVMTCLSEAGHCPVLANTSLNQRDEPLINSAVRAVRLMSEFESIQGIFLGNFYVEKVAK